MAYARCQRRHWFRYGIGVKEPPVDRSGPEFGSAVARGQIVHDVLEHLREEAEVDELIDLAIGRWDEDAPEPGEPAGRQYRDELKTEILAAAGHPAYRTLGERPGARRELEFVRFLAEDARLQGKADLAAAEGQGLAVLDVKTGGDAASVKQRAEGYALQRRVYAAALSDIGGMPVERFAFLFSKPGVEVSEPVGDAARAEAGAEIGRMLVEMGEEAPALTQHPWECRYCGYKAVGWCEGVPFPGKDKEGK
jgi:hypothetical protein